MSRKLKSIAMQLSDSDIQEIIRIKKSDGKKVEELRKKRDRLASQLAALDAQIIKLTGEAPAPVARKRGAPTRAARKTKINFVAKMREVFEQTNEPMRAREIVEALPGVGVKIKDAAYTRKRVSVALATNKCFEQVERGVYRLSGE